MARGRRRMTCGVWTRTVIACVCEKRRSRINERICNPIVHTYSDYFLKKSSPKDIMIGECVAVRYKVDNRI